MAEKLSVVMARKNIEDADIALFMVDATEGVSGLDASIAGYADESGRSVIIVVNKWDLVTSGERRAVSQAKAARIQEARRPQDRKLYEERLRYGLKFLSYAPVLFISFGSLEHFQLVLLAFVFAIGVLVGLELPLLMRLLEGQVEFKDIVSRVLTFDYIGALAAALMFPLVLVPHLGLVRSSLLMGAANAGVALWGTWLLAPRLVRLRAR